MSFGFEFKAITVRLEGEASLLFDTFESVLIALKFMFLDALKQRCTCERVFSHRVENKRSEFKRYLV